jgi:hypothetical protein
MVLIPVLPFAYNMQDFFPDNAGELSINVQGCWNNNREYNLWDE